MTAQTTVTKTSIPSHRLLDFLNEAYELPPMAKALLKIKANTDENLRSLNYLILLEAFIEATYDIAIPKKDYILVNPEDSYIEQYISDPVRAIKAMTDMLASAAMRTFGYEDGPSTKLINFLNQAFGMPDTLKEKLIDECDTVDYRNRTNLLLLATHYQLMKSPDICTDAEKMEHSEAANHVLAAYNQLTTQDPKLTADLVKTMIASAVMRTYQ